MLWREWFCLRCTSLHPPTWTHTKYLPQPILPPSLEMTWCTWMDASWLRWHHHAQGHVICHQFALTGRFLVNYLSMVGGRRWVEQAPPSTHMGVITAPFLYTHTHFPPLWSICFWNTYTPTVPLLSLQASVSISVDRGLHTHHQIFITDTWKELLEINGAHYFVPYKRQNK